MEYQLLREANILTLDPPPENTRKPLGTLARNGLSIMG